MFLVNTLKKLIYLVLIKLIFIYSTLYITFCFFYDKKIDEINV